MSSLTRCNYCDLRDIGARAAHEGKFTKVVPSGLVLGGYDVHVVGLREEPSPDNWRAWLMVITDHCVC